MYVYSWESTVECAAAWRDKRCCTTSKFRATAKLCLQEPLPAVVDLPVFTRGDKLSQSVVYQVTTAAPVAAEASGGTNSLTITDVIRNLFYIDQGQLSLSGTDGVQEVAAAPAIDEMEAADAHYSLQGALL